VVVPRLSVMTLRSAVNARSRSPSASASEGRPGVWMSSPASINLPYCDTRGQTHETREFLRSTTDAPTRMRAMAFPVTHARFSCMYPDARTTIPQTSATSIRGVGTTC
jgi:hypothetical protein